MSTSSAASSVSAAAGTTEVNNGGNFLLQTVCGDPKSFADFRFAELESLARVEGVEGSFYDEKVKQQTSISPYLFVQLPSAQVGINMMERSVLTKGLFECWGRGTTLEACVASAMEYPDAKKQLYNGPEESFCIRINVFGASFNTEKQKQYRDAFKPAFPNWTSPVQFSSPKHRFWIMVDQGKEKRANKQIKKLKK